MNCSVSLGVSGGHYMNDWPCEVREYYLTKMEASYYMTEFVLKATIVNSIIGVIFNILNIACLSRLVYKSSYYVYLTAIAVGDISNIILNFLFGIVRGNFPTVDTWFLHSSVLCGIHSFLVDFVCLIPVWLVALVTGIKMATLIWPLKTAIITTKKRTYTNITVTCLVIFAWCCYKIESGGFETSTAFGYKSCRDVTLPNMVFASTLLMSVVPAGVVLIMNIVILLKIRQSRKRREAFSGGQPEADTQKKQAHTNRLVLVVASAFVILVAPPRIFNLMTTIIEELPKSSYEDKIYWLKIGMDLRLVRQFCFVVYQLNFNTNFILYLVTDRNFQSVFKKILCPWKAKGENVNSDLNSSSVSQASMKRGSRSTSKISLNI